MKIDGRMFARDIEKYYAISFGKNKPTFLKKCNIWINHFGFHCVAMYRFGQFAHKVGLRFLPIGLLLKAVHHLLNIVIHLVYHVDIDAADIGPGLYIGHIGNIYVGPTVIGSNFSLTHNVTIGIGHSQGKAGVPKIGNNVWIGTGSVLSGSISIGNNVTIAPGSILSKDISGGSLVAGNPARVVQQSYDNATLMGNITISGD